LIGSLAAVQAQNGTGIQAWLQSANPGAFKTFRYDLGYPVGRILYAGSAQSVEGTTAVASLKADASSPLGYDLWTGYVEP